MCTTFVPSNMSIRYTYPSNTIQSGEFTIFVEDVTRFIQNICKIINIRRNHRSSFYNKAFKILNSIFYSISVLSFVNGL